MHPLIENNRKSIEALCREFSVEKLEAFGSIMTEAFRDDSDVDFIVHYPEGHDLGPWAGRHLELQKRLEALLGRKVDLVMPSALNNKWFRREANKTRLELFDASKITEVA